MMAFMCKSTQASAIVANDKDQIEIHSFDYMHVHNFTLCKYLQFLCITHSWCVCEGAAVHTSSTVVFFLVSGIPIVYCILNVTYTMYKLRFFFHYLFVKIALFTGLLFASIAVIPHIHVDIGLDQELALPKVMDKNDFFVFFFVSTFNKEQFLN